MWVAYIMFTVRTCGGKPFCPLLFGGRGSSSSSLCSPLSLLSAFNLYCLYCLSSPRPRTDPREAVLPCIAYHQQPKRQSTTPHWSRVLHHIGGPNQYKPCVSCAVLSIA